MRFRIQADFTIKIDFRLKGEGDSVDLIHCGIFCQVNFTAGVGPWELFEITNKKESYFAYSEKEKNEVVAKLNGNIHIQRSKGLGENGPETRAAVCEHFEYLGLEFDAEVNDKKRGIEIEISKPNSKVKAFVIPTNQELVIAKDTQEILKGKI